ncbi:MAG TPA: DUF488 domain-containing protein [Vicinamibacterales bacterium]|nr:DUF488 domain-containing protein [Vicinamibacterales bacterium]
MTIYTVGHSTRPLAGFLEILAAHGIGQLVDIRSIPRSRRHPHFSGDALAASLESAGIVYRHLRALGGMRKPRADSRNTAWRVEGFRGYADYMETPPFHAGLDELVVLAGATPTAVMCAEAVPWQCHRQLVADALVARGVEVRHILSITGAPLHTLTDFALVEQGRVAYRRLI